MPADFDPYHKWLGIPRWEQPPNHYRLLGLTLFESDPDVIEGAADQRMAHVRTHQTGPHSVDSQKLLNGIAAAKLCLLTPDRKTAYDTDLMQKQRSLVSPENKWPVVQPKIESPAPVPLAPPTRRRRPKYDVEVREPDTENPLRPLALLALVSAGVIVLVLVVRDRMRSPRQEVKPAVAATKSEPLSVDIEPKVKPAAKVAAEVASPTPEPKQGKPESSIPGAKGDEVPDFFDMDKEKPAAEDAWFKAENNANDSSGSHNGTLQGGASFAAGKVGQAFQLDGKTGYVQIPDSPDWDFGSNDFTITVWVNLRSVNGAWNVFAAHDEGPGHMSKWVYYYQYNMFTLHIKDHINDQGDANFLGQSDPFELKTNQWYKLALTRSGSTFTFFVDGISIGVATSTRAIPPVAAPLTIGWAEESFYLHGLIDELQIHNRALSASEISPPAPATSDVPSGMVHTFSIPKGTPGVLAFSPDGRRAASGCDNFVGCWDIAKKIQTWSSDELDPVMSVRFSPDGDRVLACTNKRWVILNADSGKQIDSFNIGRPIQAATISNDCRLIGVIYGDDHKGAVYSIERRRVIHKIAAVSWGPTIAFSRNNGKLVFGYAELHQFDLKTGKVKPNHIVQTTGSVIAGADFSPDNEFLATGSHQQYFPELKKNGMGDRMVRLWNVGNGQLVREFKGHREFIHPVAFSRDGKRLLSGGGGGGSADSPDTSIRLWDVRTGQLLRTFDGHKAPVCSLSVSPDGRHFLSGGVDATMILWRLPD